MSIIVKDLVYRYNRGTPYSRTALDGVNLSINRGELTVIIGVDSAGKTTLLQHLSGLLEPESGNVSIDGKQVGEYDDIFTRVGLIWQFPEQQFFADTVYGEIVYGLNNAGYGDGAVSKMVNEAMKKVGLATDFINRSPFTLSRGEMRRCAIASVLAMNTRIVIMDEPMAELDKNGREKIIECLKSLIEEGKTVIYASRRNELEKFITGRVIRMEKGKVVSQ